MLIKNKEMEMKKYQRILPTDFGVGKKCNGRSGRKEQQQIQKAIVSMANIHIQKSYCQYPRKLEQSRVSNSPHEPQKKSKYVIKYKKSIKMENKYLDQIMLNKLYMIQDIINVDNQFTKQFPISLHISINRHQAKTKKQPRYKYGKKKKDYENVSDPLPDPPPTLMLTYCQQVVSDRPVPENEKVLELVFEKMVEQTHGHIMEQIEEMEISMQLNKFTDRMLQKIKQIALNSKKQGYIQMDTDVDVRDHKINLIQGLKDLNMRQIID